MDEPEVTMPKSELEALMKTIKDLSTRVQNVESGRSDIDELSGKARMKVTKEREIGVRFLNGKPLIGLKNVGTESAPTKLVEVTDPHNQRRRYLQAEAIFLDPKTSKTEVVRLNWLEFVQNSEKRKLKVVKTNEEPWEIEDGVVRKREVDGYSMVELDIEVPVINEGSVRTFIVDVDGIAVSIHEDYANI